MAKPYKLPFGRLKGHSLEEVLVSDPDYFAWLQSQSDFISKRADLARAFQELGVTGDNTPVHNALQAMFLDDAICEKLLRSIIRKNAIEAIRYEVFKARKARIMGPISVEWSGSNSTSSRIPKKLLADKLTKMEARKALVAALAGSDLELREAQKDVDRRHCPFPWIGLQALYSVKDEDLRQRAEEELTQLDRSILKLREAIAELRQKTVAGRKEVYRLRKADVDVRFTIDDRRMEVGNGSDVRVQCRLVAAPNAKFSKSDIVEWNFDLWIELKPFVSDDYPNLLRQMEMQRKLAKDTYSRGDKKFIAVVGHYGGHGASVDQVKQMFKEANFIFVLLEEMGCELPQITLPSPKSVGELPLFQSL